MATGRCWGQQKGAHKDKEPWQNFLRYLKDRNLHGVKLIVSDQSTGLIDILGDFFPEAKWQRCVVHWYRNAFAECPKNKSEEVIAMLKAIHAQEDKTVAREKAILVIEKLHAILDKIAVFVEKTVEETLSYMGFPRKYRTRIRTNDGLNAL